MRHKLDQFFTLLENLTAPHPQISDQLFRYRMRMLIGVVLTAVVCQIFSAIAILVLFGWHTVHIFFVSGILVGIFIYAQLRGPNHQRSIFITISGATILSMAWIVFYPQEGAITILLLPIIMADQFLSRRSTIIFAVITIITAFFAPIHPGGTYIDRLLFTSFLVLGGGLVVLSNLSRRFAEERLMQQFSRLAESEDLFRNIIQQAYDGVRLMTLDGKIVDWTLGMERITGISRDEALGQDMWSILASIMPEEKKGEYIPFQHSVRNFIAAASTFPRQHLVQNHTIRHRNGDIRQLETMLFPVETAQGIMICAISRDITEQHKAEEIIAQQSERLRSLFNSSPDGIVLMDGEMHILDINPLMCALHGYERDELIGQPLHILVAESAHVILDKQKQVLEEQGSMHLEVTNRHKDGGPVPLEVTASRMEIGDEHFFIAFARDIRDRRAAEDAQRESEIRFLQIAENIDEIFALRLPHELKFLYVNPALERITGIKRNIVQENPQLWLEHVHPDDRERFIEQVSAGPETYIDIEYRFVRPDGEIRWLWQRSKPVFAEDGSIEARLTMVEDVSERRATEEALRESEARFRAIAQSIPDMIFRMDREGTLLDYHIGSHTLPVEKTPELIGRRMYDVMPPVLASSIIQLSRETLRTGQVQQIEYDAEVFNDKRHYETRIVRINRNESLAIVRDITDQKRATTALAASEAKLRAIIDQSRDAIRLVDTSGVIVEWNEASTTLLGIPREEAIGSYYWDVIARIHTTSASELRESFFRMMAAIRQGRDQFRKTQCTVLPLKDEERQIDVLYFPVQLDGDMLICSIARDVTEERRAENALMDSEAKFRALFEQSQEGIQILDETGTIVGWNRGMEALTGLTREMVLGRHYWTIDVQQFDLDSQQEISQELLHDRFRIALEAVRAGDLSSYARHVQIRHLNGDQRYVHRTVFPVIVGGNIMFYSIVRDITEQRRSEEALRHSEAKFRALVDQSQEGIQMVDHNGFIIGWNRSIENLTGIPREEALGRFYWDIDLKQKDLETGSQLALTPQDKKRRFEERLDQIQRGEIINRQKQIEIRHSSGEVRYVHLTSFPVFVDQEVIFYTIVRDITEQRRSQEALRQSEAKFRAVVEQSHDAIVVFHTSWRILSWNPACTYMSGISAANALGKSIIEIGSQLAPPDSSLLDEYSEQAFTFAQWMNGQFQNKATIQGRTPFRRLDGEERIIDYIISPIAVGSEVLFCVVGRDVTESRRLEEHELALTLERERGRLIAHFIEKASHEFRTPLSIINTKLYLLERADVSPAIQKVIVAIRQQGDNILQLVDALTLLVQLDNQDAIELKRAMPISMVFQSLMAHYDNLMDQAGLNFELKIDEDLPSLSVDGQALYTAISKLLDNALAYTPSGGHIELCIERTEEDIIVQVSDNGPGIEANALPHIFERFYRADDAHTTRGLGLGLPIARRIVELHNGSVDVVSAPGKGSTFTIRLPIDPGQTQKLPPLTQSMR